MPSEWISHATGLLSSLNPDLRLSRVSTCGDTILTASVHAPLLGIASTSVPVMAFEDREVLAVEIEKICDIELKARGIKYKEME